MSENTEFVKSTEGIAGFGIFYGDGTHHFGTVLEDWKSAPKENVQLILLYKDETDEEGEALRYSICSWDYYAFDGKTFTAGNDTRKLCSDHILYGKWMETEEWERIVVAAMGTFKYLGDSNAI